MDTAEYYGPIIEELAKQGLDAHQVEEAIFTTSGFLEEEKDILQGAIQQRFAQFFTVNQTALATPTEDTGGESAGQTFLKSKEELDENEDPFLDHPERYKESKKELIVSLARVANLADERGFTKQANELDEILKSL